mgnify:CR=1 FL=1|jgi:hypothetical protein
MANYDLFHVKLGGITDNGMLHGTVTVGFWDDLQSERYNVEVPVRFPANLDASLRELREQAKDAALGLLQKATKLLEEHSADELHQSGQEEFARLGAERDARFQDELARTLSGDGPTSA